MKQQYLYTKTHYEIVDSLHCMLTIVLLIQLPLGNRYIKSFFWKAEKLPKILQRMNGRLHQITIFFEDARIFLN